MSLRHTFKGVLFVTTAIGALSLTARAQTIAPIRKRLKAEGLTRKDTAVKAYWDVNRKGLD